MRRFLQRLLHFCRPVGVLLLCLLVPVGAALYYMTAMPGTSYRAALQPLNTEEKDLAARLQRHIEAIAGSEHNVAQYQKLEQAAHYIETVLSSYGYSVRRQEFDSMAGKVRNLQVILSNGKPGNGKRPAIVVGAHYDSAPGAPGANDNGSGTAAILELARLLKDATIADGRELQLVLFVNEEPPYFKTSQMGSWVHASDLNTRGQPVLAMLSLETLGFYSDEKGSQNYPPPLNLLYPDKGNFVGFIGTLDARALIRRATGSFRAHAAFPSEGIAAPGLISGVDWSDHWSYAQYGYPALMVTDTAPYRYPHYHTSDDTPDKVDYAKLARVVKGLEQVVRELVGS
jgi:Peptidase family M28